MNQQPYEEMLVLLYNDTNDNRYCLGKPCPSSHTARKKLSQQEAIQYLEDVGLDKSFLHHSIDELSGGQRQKVSIARTLINQSLILLLDEITSALDRQSVQEIEKLIVTINQKYNVTMIWITHNLQQALTIGHYTWVMMDGELIEAGKSTLLNAPTNPRVAEFIQGVNL